MRNEHRATLAQTSKDRVKNWSNTLEATRLKREEDRIKKLENEEVSSTQKLNSDCTQRSRCEGTGVPGRTAQTAN